jgi:hypothetical protein
MATGTDTAHQTLVACSNMGICNTSTGECRCREGYEGLACDRLACPVSSAKQVCSGHGMCKSMREAGSQVDHIQLRYTSTYSLWDADKIYGCLCDEGWTDYDCNTRTCAKGDDPLTTGQVNEVQAITCTCGTTCSGSFYLVYLDSASAAINYNDNAASVASKIGAMRRINKAVTVTFSSGTSICAAGGITTSITFTTNPGNLPLLQIKKSTLASTSGTDPTITIAETTAGTRDNVACSNRGNCKWTGVCKCIGDYDNSLYFDASDGTGATGSIPNCGYQSTSITSCPDLLDGSGVCSGKGVCSGATAYTCSCYAGYTGAACQYKTCPTGKAWFDEAAATDIGHIDGVECSNRGVCDRSAGTCTCQSGFTGSACERLSCNSSCNYRGKCLPMNALALQASSNGDLLNYKYGYPNDPASTTWDHDMIQGCSCDKYWYHGPLKWDISDFAGYDCSILTCPTGDDPLTTGGVYETQTLHCEASSGTFTLTFRQQTTSAIAFDATAATVKAAFSLLKTVRAVTVTYSAGTAACSTSGVDITIQFTQSLGDLPPLTIDTTNLFKSGAAAVTSVAETVKGTKENVECSNRGVCNRSTGRCECFTGFASSDGNGAKGLRADCGYQTQDATARYPSDTKFYTGKVSKPSTKNTVSGGAYS